MGAASHGSEPRLTKPKLGHSELPKLKFSRCTMRVGTPARTVPMRREDSDDDEGSALTMTPGTTGDLDGLAAALSGIELASKAPENSSGYQGVGNPGGPDTILARALAGIAEDASTPPPPARAQPRRSPRLKPFPATPAGTGGVETARSSGSPAGGALQARECHASGERGEHAGEGDAEGELRDRAGELLEVKEDEDGQEESSPAPVSVATLASRYVVVEPEVDEEERRRTDNLRRPARRSSHRCIANPGARSRPSRGTRARSRRFARCGGSRSRRRPRRPTRRKRRMRSRRCSKRKSQSRIRRPGGEGEKHPRARFARAMTSASSVCATATSWSCTRDPVTTSRGPRGTR